MGERETLLIVPFKLYQRQSVEYAIGRVEAGDLIEVKIDAKTGNTYMLTIFSLEDERTLLSTKADGGTALSYRVHRSCNAAIKVECLDLSGFIYSPAGTLTVSVTRARSSHKTSRCPVCGAPVEPGAKYCWKCGAKLE